MRPQIHTINFIFIAIIIMFNILNLLLMGKNYLIHNVDEYLIDSSENDRNFLFFILYELH